MIVKKGPYNASKNMSKEDKSRFRHLIQTVKTDIKLNNSFDMNKLTKSDREIISKKFDYVYKSRDEIRNLKYNDESKTEEIKKGEEILKKSIEVVDKSQTARQLIEKVIEKIEGNYYIQN
jgi:hypothetical protein